MKLSAISVFCGSNMGSRPAYAAAAKALAHLLAAHNITVVYGGGRVGLMGLLADEALAAGGKVIGVIPEALVRYEVAHTGLTELHVVQTMHQRKQRMFDLSDAVIVLPGGVGTLDELFEILSWGVLGLHQKPCALLEVEEYFASLRQFLDHAVSQGFLSSAHRALLLDAPSAEEALRTLRQFSPPSPRFR